MNETEKKERTKVRRVFAYGLLLVFLVLFLVIVAVFTWKL
jgi:cell division protein FtsB